MVLKSFSSSTSRLSNSANNHYMTLSNKNLETKEKKILSGVVACLDVRTEDGDDVSQNFERSLQSMGAKTRRTFSDSVTHLIFKNGSPATLKKALSKNIYIINLLWISKCEREGKRLPEDGFVIERPQGLVLAARKRRKSMEPGKVKALNEAISSKNKHGAIKESSLTSESIEWKNRFSTKKPRIESEMRRKHIEELEREEEESLKPNLEKPIVKKEETKCIIPVNAPSSKVQEQIKARFSIGSNPSSKTTVDEPDLLAISPSPAGLVRRKRKLLGNNGRSTFGQPSNDPFIFPENLFPSLTISPKKKTIVLTNMPVSTRKKCEEAISKLGQYELSTQVTKDTTHVLVGVKRRTLSVILGLLRGAWILSPEWLLRSESKKSYLNEKEFELSKWFPSAEMARKRLRLLPNNINIKVFSSATISIDVMKELVLLAGAKLVQTCEEADIIICQPKDIPSTNKNRVLDNWLFDSIEQWRYIPIDKYRINS